MAKGMSARSGPAPDPNALRRERDSGEWVELPAEGRQGPVPEWPLTSASGRELELWDRQWSRPQALMWEKLGQTEEVALYVRSLAIAEQPNAPVAARTLVRQMLEGLGLSVPGLRMARWKIVASPERGGLDQRPARAASGSVRDRLKVVQDGEAS